MLVYIKKQCHQHCCFAIVVDAVTERVRDGSINEILYADDLVLVGKTVKDSRD